MDDPNGGDNKLIAVQTNGLLVEASYTKANGEESGITVSALDQSLADVQDLSVKVGQTDANTLALLQAMAAVGVVDFKKENGDDFNLADVDLDTQALVLDYNEGGDPNNPIPQLSLLDSTEPDANILAVGVLDTTLLALPDFQTQAVGLQGQLTDLQMQVATLL